VIKNLKAELGPGVGQLANQARLTVDDEPPDDIQAVFVLMDAATMEPVSFTVRRLRFIDGLRFTAEETHAVRSLSITIKYEESE